MKRKKNIGGEENVHTNETRGLREKTPNGGKEKVTQ